MPRSKLTDQGQSETERGCMRAIAGEKLVGDFSKEPAGVELYSHSGDTEADFDLYATVLYHLDYLRTLSSAVYVFSFFVFCCVTV